VKAISTITFDGAIFTVNKVGNPTVDITGLLGEGDIYQLSDQTYIGVRDLLENEAGEAAGGDRVVFILGAEQWIIEDTQTNNKAFDATVTFNGAFLVM